MNTSFPSLRIEGGLLSGEIIDKIAEASSDIPGQKPSDFGLEPNRPLIDEIASAWNDARSYWALFQKSLERLKPDDPATTLTRDRWMVPFFSLLGYDLQSQRKAAGIEGASYFISHRGGPHEQAPPVHITGFRQSLERRPESGVPRLAPHSLIQEYLNRSEELWGIVTNGSTLRLLRDSHLIRRQAYIEFDLKEIMEGERFADFALLYRFLHATRLPKGIEDTDICLLEQYYRITVEQGGRVRDHLRDGVERALIRFGNGFLNHPNNSPFRERAAAKEVDPFEYYQQLLRIIYRFLFLMVSEERGLISDNQLYRTYYSLTRIRNLAGTAAAYNEFEDLWVSLKASFTLFTDELAGSLLQVPPLNGDLFDSARTDYLNRLSLSNRDLLHAMWDLSMYREKDKAPWRRINYAALDVEELGSVYESLLEFQPVFTESDGKINFDLITGTERKSTGSYYTPPELVNELIQSALVPVIEDRLKEAKTPAQKEQQLLSLTVCDPACGSGHFLLAAARKIGKELAKSRTGDEEPAPEQMRIAIRDVITHCIYGVDKNPLAVDLCKVALWLEGHTMGKPLTFLDHRIRCGDSLVGVYDLSVLKGGIPDEAFTAVTGDDKAVAREIKKQNKKEREHRQLGEFDVAMGILSSSRQQVNAIADDNPADIRKKRELFSAFQQEGTAWCKDKTACDLWTATFFVGLTKEHEQEQIIPTTNTVKEYLAGGVNSDNPQVKIARQLASEFRFFHWKLEFPEIFILGGFDCVVGNPPWEKIKLQEKEFFSTKCREIALAQNKAARKRFICDLPKTNQNLLIEYQKALYSADAQSKFLRSSGRFPLSGRGDINTYAIFAEQFYHLINPKGQAGIILPTGIATDDSTKSFFNELIQKKKILSLYGFENEAFIFPSVHHSFKFCILTMVGLNKNVEFAKFMFYCRYFKNLKQSERCFEISKDDLIVLNPNTNTCPIFRTNEDAKLTKMIYNHFPIFINENNNSNLWNVTLMSMFHMSNDSHLFLNEGGKTRLPLYESKMLHQFDHRWATIDNGVTREVEIVEKMNPYFTIKPRYWVEYNEYHKMKGDRDLKIYFAYRKVTSAISIRTVIASILCDTALGESAWMIIPDRSLINYPCLFTNLNSLVLDYIARQKLGGNNLNFFTLKQLPIIPPDAYTPNNVSFIVPRVLELTYTAWDIKAFADDVWRDADDAMKSLLRQQWEANKAATGGHEWKPPEWAVVEPDGIPLPPFKWDEDRRAVLRAELDALYAKLYGLSRDDLRYILDPFDVYGPDFPGETFRVLKEKETKKYGEYRTRRLVLEAWDQQESGCRNDN